MRRTLIQTVLPFAFCLVPPLVGVVTAAAIPTDAMHDYLARIRTSPMDWLILALGAVLFVLQTVLAWRALRWVGTSFDESPDRWLSNLAQAAEWFPLLGLLGTVAAILQTFSSITGTMTPKDIITKYAPAITATGSGLFMALINILPTWVVTVGRDLILAVGGGQSTAEE